MADPCEILKRGVEQGLHPGGQLFVWHRGKVVIDFACGTARPGIPMRTDSIVQWFSSGKPLTAICIAQLYERGELLLDDKVTRFVPEFGTNEKEGITLWHLLTHTGGFRSADNVSRRLPWTDTIRQICEAPLEAGWIPGEKAGYSTQASWMILGEIIRRVTNIEFAEYIRRELLLPLEMRDTWLSLPRGVHEAHCDRVAQMFDTLGAKLNISPLQDAAGMEICRPGASARGPVNDLARFYRMLLHRGELEGHCFLREETIRLFTQRQREGLYDHTFGHTLDYGLGFIVNSNRYGADTVPYGYGRYASEDTFGHSGAQSSCAFADPKNGLVVAWMANGMPGESAHQQRQRAVNNAVYEWLDLAH